MALMKHEVERINDIMSLVVEFADKDRKAKKLLQSLLNNYTKQDNSAEFVASNDEQEEKPKVIRQIVEVPVEIEKIVYQDRIVEKLVEVTPEWVDSLKPFLDEVEFFEKVSQEPALAQILLPNQSTNIKQLIVNASQWNNILRVWDELANIIKCQQIAISDNQMKILLHCLKLFNLTLSNRQVRLDSPEVGDSYDYEIHEQVMGDGDSITQVLLPSLCNAGDERVRPALVATR
jgi:hypothetical protein